MASKANNIIRDTYWDLTRDEIDKLIRLTYLLTFVRPIPNFCPECYTPLEYEEDEKYCPHCGLVTSTTVEYVAGQRISIPYGRMI